MKNTALVLMPLNKQQQDMFFSVSPNITFDFCSADSIDRERISGADIIIGNPPPSMLMHARKLKWIQLVTAGADKYQGKNILDEKVLLTSASGAYGEAQSEFMFASLLSLYKNLHLYRDSQNKHLWRDEGNERMLRDAAALVIGMGDIGTSFAKRLKAFGVYVIGVRRHDLRPTEYADELHSVEHLGKLLPRADIVSLTVPATPSTRHLLNREMFSLMKPETVLVNAGRGSTVDTEALCDALENRQLSGACLDVMEPEPLPPTHRLWSMRNVIITPHVAGQDFLPCTMEKTVTIAIDNLKAFLSGKPLKNILSHQNLTV